MPLPKFVAVGVCAGVLGAQLLVSFPITRYSRGWYWPFLPYPMYSVPHAETDTLVVAQLRVSPCGGTERSTIMPAEELGVPLDQMTQSLVSIARAPAGVEERGESARLSRAIDAQYPGRYCAASAWLRVVRVSDSSTHHVDGPMRLAARWTMMEQIAK
jgi:hypothetical protein